MFDRVLEKALRGFFRHFYHDFAWTYEGLAGIVSLGRWNDWVQSVTPYLRGPRVLELGHGPGYLQHQLKTTTRMQAVGIDESAEMGFLAQRRWPESALAPPLLARAVADRLPFRSGVFQTVVATFPTEFILDAATLADADRVLAPEGRLVIVPAAWIMGGAFGDRLAAWLFRVTHQAPPSSDGAAIERLVKPLQQAGFITDVLNLYVKSSRVLIILAHRPTKDLAAVGSI